MIHDKNIFFKKIIDAAKRGVSLAEGGPFGACIVYQNEIIAIANNTVLKDQDPTCHAEINVIRLVAKKFKSYQLDACHIYSTSEPCPMCLSAIYWAGIKTCHFIADKKMAAGIGFDDTFIYDELKKSINDRNIQFQVYPQFEKELKNIFEEFQKSALPIY